MIFTKVFKNPKKNIFLAAWNVNILRTAGTELFTSWITFQLLNQQHQSTKV